MHILERILYLNLGQHNFRDTWTKDDTIFYGIFAIFLINTLKW